PFDATTHAYSVSGLSLPPMRYARPEIFACCTGFSCPATSTVTSERATGSGLLQRNWGCSVPMTPSVGNTSFGPASTFGFERERMRTLALESCATWASTLLLARHSVARPTSGPPEALAISLSRTSYSPGLRTNSLPLAVYITWICASLPTVIFCPFASSASTSGRWLPSIATSPFRFVTNATLCANAGAAVVTTTARNVRNALFILHLRFNRHGCGAHRADAPYHDRAVPLQVMAAQRIELEALFDPAHHGLGYEDLASEVLGESLKPSG